MKKKVLSAILCIAMVATMLIGCSSGGSSDSGDSGDSGSDEGSGGGRRSVLLFRTLKMHTGQAL